MMTFHRPWLYLIRGRRPWSLGYVEYKEQQIQHTLADSALMQDFTERKPLPDKYGWALDERMVEFPWILSRLPKAPATRLLDAGSTINFDFILRQPALHQANITIMTLAPEDRAFWQSSIAYVYGDLRTNPFRTDWFDAITCISTLEHVGMDNSIYTADAKFHEDNRSSYLEVIKEFYRVLKPGGKLFLTVPYGIYKQCGFQQVFTAEMVAAVIAAFGGQVVEQTFFRYRSTGWQWSTQADCNDADYYEIRKTPAIPSDYAAAARAVACIILQK